MNVLRWLARVASMVLVLGASWSAHANGLEDLEDGIAAYEMLQTDRAAERLRAASRAWDLTPAQRARAFLYLGMLSFELGDSAKAKRAWQASITLDPTLRPPRGSSPKIVRAYGRVARTLPDPPPPVPPADPPPRQIGGSDRAPVSPPPPPPPVPSIATAPPPAPPPPTEPPPISVPAAAPESNEDEDEGTSPWLWVGLGGATVAVAAAVLVVVLAGGDDNGSECEQGGGGCITFGLR